MSRIKKAAILLLAVLAIPLGLVFLRPDIVLLTLLRSSAQELGYEIQAMQVSQLGLRASTLEQLVVVSIDQRLEFHNLTVSYSPAALLAGRIETIEIASTEIQTLVNLEPAPVEEETTLAALLSTFDELPIESLDLPQIRLLDEANGIELDASLQSPPLRVNGSVRSKELSAAALEFEMQRASGGGLDIAWRALLNETLALESTMQLNAKGSDVEVVASSTLFMEPLSETLSQALPAATALLNESLTVQSRFDIQRLFDSPSLSGLALSLDSPNSLLQLRQESDLGLSTVRLQLPIRLTGDIAPSTGELRLALSQISGSGSWTIEGSEFRIESLLEDSALHCASFGDCDLTTQWSSELGQWRLGEYSGDAISLSAPLRFNYANDEMRLAADLVRIEVPALRGPQESPLTKVSTSLQLDELELRVGDVISGGFNLSSSELSLDNTLVDFRNPAYSGRIQLEEDVLTGILEIDLDQRLRLGIGLQHFLLRDTGDVVLQLAMPDFSESDPLSTLITAKQLDADIVAGHIEGLANISWSKQLDESWRFGGPIALKFEQLSGYYEDYYFVDLSSDLFAEATTPLGMQVTNPSSATLRRVDIGLPLENLSLQYRFDTLAGEVQLNDFSTELLGGRLSVPAARYDPNRERQQVDVVLADLSVEQLIALAEYPGIQADGLISGYLPFVIEGNTLTIEKGLVGALNPGGSIRYTPADNTRSSNASLQLVNDALSNYQYQTMNTEVYYDDAGELLLTVQLHGRNPDMNNGQAINLNVNITDNIPSLLKSLQASRVISDELERFVSQP